MRKVADNISGTIWYAATQVNPTLPVTGSGSLAWVTLLPQATGTFSMPFTYQKLAAAHWRADPGDAPRVLDDLHGGPHQASVPAAHSLKTKDPQKYTFPWTVTPA